MRVSSKQNLCQPEQETALRPAARYTLHISTTKSTMSSAKGNIFLNMETLAFSILMNSDGVGAGSMRPYQDAIVTALASLEAQR